MKAISFSGSEQCFEPFSLIDNAVAYFLFLLITATFSVHCYIGGSASSPHQWPWMGLLITGPEDWSICGCSIVSEQWLLTAAHCVRLELGDPLTYYAILGEHNRDIDEGTEIRRNFSEVHRYPLYESTNHSFDIALLKMDKPINFKDYVNIKPICLDLKGVNFQNDRCVGTGWGRLGKYGEMPSVLKQLYMRPFDHKKCSEIHHNYYQNEDSKEEVTENQFCMVSLVNKYHKRYSSGSVTSGDSGGPLQCFINGKWKQVGVSWSATKFNFYPSVYNYVHKYASWIKNITLINDESYC